mmetsp:Transcript_28965/g.85685  ORF Transcript_28965/g.85685 Transcript_28965/m.85685 type:complete len:204 (-) Transcript_28965:3739-4350(-)
MLTIASRPRRPNGSTTSSASSTTRVPWSTRPTRGSRRTRISSRPRRLTSYCRRSSSSSARSSSTYGRRTGKDADPSRPSRSARSSRLSSASSGTGSIRQSPITSDASSRMTNSSPICSSRRTSSSSSGAAECWRPSAFPARDTPPGIPTTSSWRGTTSWATGGTTVPSPPSITAASSTRKSLPSRGSSPRSRTTFGTPITRPS